MKIYNVFITEPQAVLALELRILLPLKGTELPTMALRTLKKRLQSARN